MEREARPDIGRARLCRRTYIVRAQGAPIDTASGFVNLRRHRYEGAQLGPGGLKHMADVAEIRAVHGGNMHCSHSYRSSKGG